MHPDVEKLIPRALIAVQHYFLLPGTTTVKKEYDGYAASLGAAIRTSGLLPALTFYTDISRDYPFRSDVLEAIHFCLGDGTSPGEPRAVRQGKPTRNLAAARSLLTAVLQATHGLPAFNDNGAGAVTLGTGDEAEKRKWMTKITQASVALKLAMRNFEHTTE